MYCKKSLAIDSYSLDSCLCILSLRNIQLLDFFHCSCNITFLPVRFLLSKNKYKFLRYEWFLVWDLWVSSDWHEENEITRQLWFFVRIINKWNCFPCSFSWRFHGSLEYNYVNLISWELKFLGEYPWILNITKMAGGFGMIMWWRKRAGRRVVRTEWRSYAQWNSFRKVGLFPFSGNWKLFISK